MKDPVWWWWCGGGGGGVVVRFFVIIIPTPVWVFDLDFDWGVAKKEERLNDGNNNGQLRISNATSGGAHKAASAKK